MYEIYSTTLISQSPVTAQAIVQTLTNLASSPSYASDAAAAAGGVAVGQPYRNGSIMMTRIS
jgi:hypothetical protein